MGSGRDSRLSAQSMQVLPKLKSLELELKKQLTLQEGQVSEVKQSVEKLQLASFSEQDRIYMREIGSTVDQLVDQINAIMDKQDELALELSRV